MRAWGEHGSTSSRPCLRSAEMAGFERELLHFFALDPLRKYSEDFVPLDGNNPFRFRLNGVTYSIHISFIHDSGANRDNDDEVRIQISRAQIDLQKTRAACGEVIGFLGFFREGDVFVGWDPAHVLSLQAKTVVSVYARQIGRASCSEGVCASVGCGSA